MCYMVIRCLKLEHDKGRTYVRFMLTKSFDRKEIFTNNKFELQIFTYAIYRVILLNYNVNLCRTNDGYKTEYIVIYMD